MKVLRFIAAVLLIGMIASCMAILGSVLMSYFSRNALFEKYDLVLPSLLAWALLSWPLRKPTSVKIVVCGALSVVVGAFWTCLLGKGIVQFAMAKPHGLIDAIRYYIGAIVYAFVGSIIFVPVALPIALVTAWLIKEIWKQCGLQIS